LSSQKETSSLFKTKASHTAAKMPSSMSRHVAIEGTTMALIDQAQPPPQISHCRMMYYFLPDDGQQLLTTVVRHTAMQPPIFIRTARQQTTTKSTNMA
jgi:hypothetical protein